MSKPALRNDMNDNYDYLIFIGRFEPFHNGHRFVVEQALSKANKVIILIGSANSPRTIKNPFNYQERVSMIRQCFNNSQRILFAPIDDDLYNDYKWLKNIQNAVAHLVKDQTSKIGVIGHHKDGSSYYLSLFVQWDFVALPNFHQLSATPMRHAYFERQVIDEHLPVSSAMFLSQFLHSEAFVRLQKEYQHILSYQKTWQSAPYPPVFVTADALVVQSGHILLIERGGEYGCGLWALAGGFLDKNETLLACAIRELYEETGLILDKTALKASQTFDAPDRSVRGRTVTTVFHFELTGTVLPDVQGRDDAARAFWLPLNQLDGTKMFEDHESIIKKMLAL